MTMKKRENRSVKVEMRITPALKEAALIAAKDRGVSLSRWMEILIKQEVYRITKT